MQTIKQEIIVSDVDWGKCDSDAEIKTSSLNVENNPFEPSTELIIKEEVDFDVDWGNCSSDGEIKTSSLNVGNNPFVPTELIIKEEVDIDVERDNYESELTIKEEVESDAEWKNDDSEPEIDTKIAPSSENDPLELGAGRDDGATTRTSTGWRGPRGKTAQYYRDYRARKRAELEKESLNRPRVVRSVTPKKRKSDAEYRRAYRARKKAERENMLIDPLGVIPSSSTIGFAKPTRRKTPAEYQRAYRERKKAQRESWRAARTNDDSIEIADENTGNVGDENARINPQVPCTQSDQHKEAQHNFDNAKSTRRKTPAEYQREYRERKKAQLKSMRAATTNDQYS